MLSSYPNRCQHIKVNGTQCGSPALRRNRLCYFHKRHHDERVALRLDHLKTDRVAPARRRRIAIDLPVLEDANSIQVSLMQIMRLLIAGQIEHKTAGLLLYALQTASSNLPRTQFDPEMHHVILDTRAVGETPLGQVVWDDEDFDEAAEEDDETLNPARDRGIMRAAEYLYDLNIRHPTLDSFLKDEKETTPPPPPAAGNANKKKPASDKTAAEVRQEIRQEVINAAPKILAANPGLKEKLGDISIPPHAFPNNKGETT
jgi:hypothetical protein